MQEINFRKQDSSKEFNKLRNFTKQYDNKENLEENLY
jgi:hypothetical protein